LNEGVGKGLEVWLEAGSALLLTGASFLDYAHGIRSQASDVFSRNVINFNLLKEETKEKLGNNDEIMVERKQRNESQMKKIIKVPVMTTNTGRKREKDEKVEQRNRKQMKKER